MDTFKEQTICKAKTKVNGTKHESIVTIDWTGVTMEEMQQLAQRSLIIRKQNEDRIAGIVPPRGYTLKAKDYTLGKRKGRAPVDPVKVLSNMPLDDLIKALEAAGHDKAEIMKMLRAKAK